MSQDEKPFACSNDGCNMSFTNEDHLNCHQKKHDMMLSLGIENKSSDLADQTPTPTRFIRNCEEVGLFQDLQNVNPFDETFKKAIESNEKECTLHVSALSANNDDHDTLHTPHFFPQIEKSTEIKLITKTLVSSDENDSDDSFTLTIDTDTKTTSINKNSAIHCKNSSNLRSQLKMAIQNKTIHKSNIPTPTLIGTTIRKTEIDKTIEVTRLLSEQYPIQNCNLVEKKCSNKRVKPKTSSIDKETDKIRESNRVAQLRCRKRKKIALKKILEENQTLKNDNIKLQQENEEYKSKMYTLKELVLQNKNNKLIENLPFYEKVKEVLNKQHIISSKNVKKQTKIHDKQLVPVLPKGILPLEQKTLFIQMLTPTATIPL